MGRFTNCPSQKTQRNSTPTMAKNQVIPGKSKTENLFDASRPELGRREASLIFRPLLDRGWSSGGPMDTHLGQGLMKKTSAILKRQIP